MASEPVRRLPDTFRALRNRNYRLWFAGQMISLIGTWMQMIAQQWLVYRLTGSAAALGIMSLAPLIPLLPLSLWAGSMADRWPKRDILVVTQTVMMLQAFLLTALVWTNTVQVWHVVALAVVLGGAQAVDAPARQSFVVELVDDRNDLTNAIGLNSTIFNAGRAIGPAVAGVAVATTGEGGAFLINGITFLAVIGGLLMMQLPKAVAVKPAASLSHMREGVRFLTRNQDVLVIMSIVGVSAFLSMPYSTLLPVFAKDVVGASAQPMVDLLCSGSGLLANCQSPDAVTYGFLMAAGGIGAVTGALFVASLPPGARRGRWLTAGNLAFPALLIAMAASQSFWITTLLLVGIGFAFVAQNALANTLVQIAVPDEVRGRVMSVYTLSFQGMMRLGGMQAGFVGEAVGAPVSVGVGAVISLLFGLVVAIRYPRVRDSA